MVKIDLVGIDKQFYELLIDLPNKVNFPDRFVKLSFDNDFFLARAKQIFLNCYRYYTKTLNNSNKLKLDKKLTEDLNKTHLFSYLVSKTGAMERLFFPLRYYCQDVGVQVINRDFRKNDIFNYVNQGFGTSGAPLWSGKTQYERDHTLHQYNLFFLGLYLYFHSPFLQNKFKVMLKNAPECIAKTGPNKDINFQFFEQWFITATMHDIGRVIRLQSDVEEVSKIIFRWNYLLKRIKEVREPKLPCPGFVSFDITTPRLDVGKFYDINYNSHPQENHLTRRNFWNNALRQIEQWEKIVKLDHGINSAKLLLKLSNISVKISEVRKRQPWVRYSYRNYVLPAFAIAKHNLVSKGKLPSVISFCKEPQNEQWKTSTIKFETSKGIMNIDKSVFDTDFLTALLVVCDEFFGDFERLGSKEVQIGKDFKLSVNDQKENSITIYLKH